MDRLEREKRRTRLIDQLNAVEAQILAEPRKAKKKALGKKKLEIQHRLKEIKDAIRADIDSAKWDNISRSESLQIMADHRRRNRMERVDSFPQPIRFLVHNYGLSVVQAFLDNGVTDANQIRHLVETVLDEFSPTRGTRSLQGQSSSENQLQQGGFMQP